jgi:hypothetical protein
MDAVRVIRRWPVHAARSASSTSSPRITASGQGPATQCERGSGPCGLAGMPNLDGSYGSSRGRTETSRFPVLARASALALASSGCGSSGREIATARLGQASLRTASSPAGPAAVGRGRSLLGCLVRQACSAGFTCAGLRCVSRLPGRRDLPDPGALAVVIGRAAQRPAGACLSAGRPARSAAAVMLRSIPPKTTPWNGDMDRQYACPASPRGWKIARWL